MSDRRERLNSWVETLDIETLRKIVLETVSNLIDFEYVGFGLDEGDLPYWDTTRERLDGTPYSKEDED